MRTALGISDYANDIKLFEEFTPTTSKGTPKEEIVDIILTELNQEYKPALSYPDKRRFLHGILNTLSPHTLSTSASSKLDELLLAELNEKSITKADAILHNSEFKVGKTNITVWQGDITTLAVDAIVNAANSQMLGCFQPLHACIDNAIHSAAGVQLRDDCDVIMQKQGFPEPTGTAKITRAYNLPSKFVLHTVGPIVQGTVTEKHKSDLASAYINCLNVCKEMGNIKSIAFCGISTGVFGYPAEQAAQVAYNTVNKWLAKNPVELELVVFNTFGNRDNEIYNAIIPKI